jgi:hypothetical protein
MTNSITRHWQLGTATGDEAKGTRFKRKIFKKIYGPFNVNGVWYIRYSLGILYAA